MQRCRFRIYNYIFINTNVNAGNKVTHFLDFAIMWKFVINDKLKSHGQKTLLRRTKTLLFNTLKIAQYPNTSFLS